MLAVREFSQLSNARLEKGALAVKWISFLLAALVCLVAGLVSASASSIWGINGHFMFINEFHENYSSYWRADKTLPYVKELRATWIRDAVFAYSHPRRATVFGNSKDPILKNRVVANRESVNRYLSIYDEAGLKLILAIVGSPKTSRQGIEYNEEFFAWVAELSTKHPSIAAVELHNEPNLPQFWRGTPEEYVETYRRAAEVIKEKRPDLPILVPSLANMWWPPAVKWLERAAAAGLFEFATGVSVHPYNKSLSPEFDPHFGGGGRTSDPQNYEKAVVAFWKMVKGLKGGEHLSTIYFTEFGYASNGKGMFVAADEEQQADYLSRALLIQQDLRLRGIPIAATCWYDLKDDGQKSDNEQHNYGLVNFDLTRRKPAFLAFRSISTFFPDIGSLEVLEQLPRVTTRAPEIVTKAWRRKTDNATIVAFWSLETQGLPSDVESSFTLRQGIQEGPVSYRLWRSDGSSEVQSTANARDGVIEVPIKATSRAAWVEVLSRS